MNKDVIILAGGYGTRLRSVLKDKAKCLETTSQGNNENN